MAGLSSLTVQGDTTSFTAGTGDDAVEYKIYSTYLNDKAEGKTTPDTEESRADQDNRAKKTKVCIEAKGICEKDKTEKFCMSRDGNSFDVINDARNDVFGNPQGQNHRDLQNLNSCPAFKGSLAEWKNQRAGTQKGIFSMSSTGSTTLGLIARDRKGENVAKVDLDIRGIVTSDQRPDSKAAQVIKNYLECKKGGGKKDVLCRAGLAPTEAEFNHFAQIENRLEQYVATFSPYGNNKDKTQVVMSTSYYTGRGTGTPTEPVELLDDPGKFEKIESDKQKKIAAVHRADVTSWNADKKDAPKIRNSVEYAQDNFSPVYRGIPTPGGSGVLETGEARTPMKSDGCKITGGKSLGSESGSDGNASLDAE